MSVINDALTLNYQANAYGNTIIVVTGTSNGKTVNDYFSVSVTPVNDAPVISSLDGNTSASVIVLENQNFVTEVNATDIDGDTLTYLISGGTDQSKFDINSSSGEITFKSAPDFEAPADSNSDNLYTVEITVSDDDTTSLSDIQNISVFVTNSDDSPVVANPLSDFTVNEDATDSTIDLSNVFNDVDNNNAAIVKSVTSSNNSLVNASVAGNT